MALIVKDFRKLDFDEKRILSKIDYFSEGLGLDKDSLDKYKKGVVNQIQTLEEIDFRDVNSILISNAIDYILDIKSEEGEMDFNKLENTNFQFLAARVLLNSLYKRASKNRSYDVDNKYGDFYGLLSSLGEEGLIDKRLFTEYTKEEVKELEDYIKPNRDNLLTYAGLYNMSERYLIRAKDKNRSIYELPQERYMIISMYILMEEERKDRIQHIKDLYDELSQQKITMATPIFSNAGRPNAQLSSCFIATTEDSLRGIYDDNTDIALVSKNGGGIGTYLSNLRAAGSDIQGNLGASGGVLGWIKQLNNTATSVDQLGTRAGAIAIYLDVWHLDIEDFLELKLNTGDLKKRAHEIFPAICIPDTFMEMVKQRKDWYLFDPHTLEKEMGFKLQDFYDKEKWDGKSLPDKEKNAFTYHYFLAVDNNELLLKKRVPAIEIMKKIMISQLETGNPFMFYRDSVNRENPNSHEGMIYSSNLCTEILNNQSPTIVVEEKLDKEGYIHTVKKAGDFVVCNLSSIVLNNAVDLDLFSIEESKREKALEKLKKTLEIQVRATDATIEINNLPVKQATYTNNRYRAIGLGEQGIASLLAKMNVPFDSHEGTEVISELEEILMRYIIEASCDLAQEKGSYPLFEGSQWSTGEWIDRLISKGVRNVSGWEKTKEKVKTFGLRNGYLRAVAPTGSTSLLAGSTAGVDTIFDTIFFDGKKDSKTPVIAPELSLDTWFYYKPTMLMDFEEEKDLGHMWAILHNEKRQVFIDQSSSFNIYVLDDIKAPNLLRLHEETWSRGIKTSYYIRSQDASKIDTCIACSS